MGVSVRSWLSLWLFVLATGSHSVEAVVVVPIGTGIISRPAGVALDASGNVYAADGTSVRIFAAPNYTTVTSLPVVPGGMLSFRSVAVDSKKNVFVADYSNDLVKEFVAPAYTTVINVAALSAPAAIAFDSSDNLFVAYDGPWIKKLLASNGYASDSYGIVAISFYLPSGMAFDGADNLYVADAATGVITKVLAPNYVDSVPLGSGFAAPGGVAVDSAGNVFVADTEHNAIKEIVLAYGTIATIGSGFGHPADIKVGAGGNLFVADSDNYVIKKVLTSKLTISNAFGAAVFPLQGNTTLTFDLHNGEALTTQTGLGFVDALPNGLFVANGPDTSASCNGVVTAVPGSGLITLANASLAPGATCSVTVHVRGYIAGAKTNSVTATSTQNGTSNTAFAFTKVAAPPTIAVAFTPTSVSFHNTSTLGFTIGSPNDFTGLSAIAFSDTLPAGLVVATPNGLLGNCGGGTIAATAGSSVISLAGATLAGSATCAFSVKVKAIAPGAQNNQTDAITSSEGGIGTTASASLLVGKSPSSIGLTTSCPRTFVAGAPFTMKATVYGYNPTGSVNFYIPGCTAAPLVSATASCTTSDIIELGYHQAGYLGDGNNNPSTNGMLFLTVLDPDDVAFRNGFGAPSVQCEGD